MMSDFAHSESIAGLANQLRSIAFQAKQKEIEFQTLKRKLEDRNREVMTMRKKFKDEMMFKDFFETRVPCLIMEIEEGFIDNETRTGIALPYKDHREMETDEARMKLVRAKNSRKKDCTSENRHQYISALQSYVKADFENFKWDYPSEDPTHSSLDEYIDRKV
jgi:hypothetical protein